MSNTGMYREIKDALQTQIQTHLNSLGEKIDVYAVPYQSIPLFPAVALELTSRRKVKKGLGVRQLELDMVVWVYVDIFDTEQAEEECLRITELIEDAIEKDKSLSGQVNYLSLDDLADFGTVQNGEASFLQGAKLSVKIHKLFK